MKKISLTKNKLTVVDDEDFEYINQFKWHFGCRGYAVHRKRIGSRSQNKSIVILMHRLVMNAPKDLQVDHINGDKLDNRKENLRLATSQQNVVNSGSRKNSKIPYKGVYLHHGRYESRITMNGKCLYLGGFHNPEDAAKAYDKKAKELFGEFARLNFIMRSDDENSY